VGGNSIHAGQVPYTVEPVLHIALKRSDISFPELHAVGKGYWVEVAESMA
jgi:hypothetical protein